MGRIDVWFRYLQLFILSRYGYVLVIVLFSVWVVFFDSNSILKRMQLKTENAKIEREIEQYRESIADSELKIKTMSDDRESLEKYARERYGMQEPDEVVLLFDE